MIAYRKPGEPIQSFINDLIKKNKIVIFIKKNCNSCQKVKDLFNNLKKSYVALDLEELGNKRFF